FDDVARRRLDAEDVAMSRHTDFEKPSAGAAREAALGRGRYRNAGRLPAPRGRWRGTSRAHRLAQDESGKGGYHEHETSKQTRRSHEFLTFHVDEGTGA